MPSLRELQQGFAAAMAGAGDGGIGGEIVGGSLGADARLGVYRHAITATRLRVLQETFPAVESLVGGAFFEQLAQRYASHCPSHSGNLCAYGGDFPSFIARCPQATDPVPYLADVAWLEWRRQEAALAADAEIPRQVRVLSGEPARLRAQLHPSLRSIESAFPVISIHLWCGAPEGPPPSLDAGAECGLIWRSGAEVAEAGGHPATHAAVEVLRRGRSLADAAAAGAASDPQFDLDECLRSLIASDLIVDVIPLPRSP